jgi:hypothetical protein
VTLFKGAEHDMGARADILSIADVYQKIAERAASRLKTLSPDEAKPAPPPST